MDISSILNKPAQNDLTQAHTNYVDIHALNDLKKQAREDQRSALKPVAEQFESLFLEQIFKEARKVKLDDGWLDGNQGDFFKDWHDKQLAQDIAAKGSLGFADNIVEQLLPSIPNINKADTQAQLNQAGTQGKTVQSPADQMVETMVSTQQAITARPITHD